MKSPKSPWQHIKKQRHYFTNKGPSWQIYGFSISHVWMWELDYKESWVSEIDAFELWCWRRLLRVSWNSRRSNESILKEISPEYSLEGLMLKLKLQYSGHLMWRTDSLEKTLMLGKIESGRFFECWVSSQLFHSPLSPSSRGSLVSLYFLPLEWYHLHIWGCWYFFSSLDFSLWLIQPGI